MKTTRRKNAATAGAQNLSQWLMALSNVCTRKRQAKGDCSPSSDAGTHSWVEMIRNTPASKRKQFAEEQSRKRGRKVNPGGQTAAELYEAFHGKPATRTLDVTEKVVYSADLADLGELIELQVILPSGKQLATVDFAGKGISVAANGKGTELHFAGGNQSLDLTALHAGDQVGKPNVFLGEAYKITYFTSKAFHNFTPSEYEHEFGEEDGTRPLLCYDPRSRKLYLVGGSYEVKPEGIRN